MFYLKPLFTILSIPLVALDVAFENGLNLVAVVPRFANTVLGA
jgi:hypothetical protein